MKSSSDVCSDTPYAYLWRLQDSVCAYIPDRDIICPFHMMDDDALLVGCVARHRSWVFGGASRQETIAKALRRFEVVPDRG